MLIFLTGSRGERVRQEYINIILRVPWSLYRLNLIKKIQESEKMFRKSLSTKGSNSSIELAGSHP